MYKKQNQALPFQLTIGVTGHRKLQNIESLKNTLQAVFEDIRLKNSDGTLTPLKWCALTPLAEGADRLIANEILKQDKDNSMKVVLPLTIEDCLETFSTEDSKAEFLMIMSKTKSPLSLREKSLKEEFPEEMIGEARTRAYEDAGRFVVDHSDILIALWDYKPARGRGGTAEIIEYAKKMKCPIYLIDTIKPDGFQFIDGEGSLQGMNSIPR